MAEQRVSRYGIRWSEWHGEGEMKKLITYEQTFDSRVRMNSFMGKIGQRQGFVEVLESWAPSMTYLSEL